MKQSKKRTARRALRIKKGDMVVAIAGEDAVRGRTGKVLQILPKQQKAVVEGFNYIKKHMRKSEDNPHGGVVEKEAPVHVSNLRKVRGDDGPAAAKPAAE
jgi:large subunit ribosomal protein L24